MARVNPAKTLDALTDALRGAREGDVEALHRVRTLSRRLLVWLELAEVRVLRDDLKWLLKETSALRDLDVFDALLTPEGRTRLRTPALERAHAALRDERIPGLLAAFRALGTIRRRRARRGVEALTQALESARFPETMDGVHALRKLVRRVRYGLEWLGEDATALRALQDTLGVLCDVGALKGLVGR